MRRSAFTLIEMLVVIGILVGVIGVAMLSLTDFRRESELRAIADRLESVCEMARAEALRHGRPVEIILREPARAGSLRMLTRRLDPAAEAQSAENAALAPPPAARVRTELPSWLVIDEQDAEPRRDGGSGEAADTRLAVFLPDGSALGAAETAFRDSRASARVTLTIDGLTGVAATAIDWNAGDETEPIDEPEP